MENLLIEATEETPKVEFDRANNVYSMSGRSLPEDASSFFQKLFDWMEELSYNPPKSFSLDINLDYFNSSSAKHLVELIIVLEKISEKGNDVSIKWLYEEDDELMETRGKEIESIVNIPFIFSPIKA